ncbi:MAG: CoA-binding protein [Candidatus Aenigmarchaeota archaeon]|nr:CoA-binding protein [Candidatus Aenigmarchaeota archaeon]
MKDLDYFFNPKSIAVIGASRHAKKFGYIILENLIDNEYAGKVYPVNPKADYILGKKCYSSVSKIPGSVDLAVIVVPAKNTPEVIRDCARKNVKAAIIISGGFGEAGNKKLEEEVMEAKGKMRIIGPNVIGIYDAYSKVDTIFSPNYRQKRPEKGAIGFISQSGAFGAAVLDWAATQSIGVSKFISIGNRIDVDEVDLLRYLANDRETKAIAVYLEGAKRGRELYNMLRHVVRKKPVVFLKAGKSTEARAAISSHTGSLAGESEIYVGMCEQAGAICVKSSEKLIDLANALAHQPLPKGDCIQVVTNGGGFGVLATDSVVSYGMKMAKLDRRTIDKIKSSVPAYASVSNPMDLVGDADAERYKIALDAVLKDRNVSGVIVILLMQISALESNVVNILVSLKKKYDKPLLVCTTGGEFTNMHARMLEKEGIPTYSSPKRAASAMKALVDYSKTKKMLPI